MRVARGEVIRHLHSPIREQLHVALEQLAQLAGIATSFERGGDLFEPLVDLLAASLHHLSACVPLEHQAVRARRFLP
ncbi:MAG: hypothetical protein ACYTFT_14385 [Planctomycetota bacterium]